MTEAERPQGTVEEWKAESKKQRKRQQKERDPVVVLARTRYAIFIMFLAMALVAIGNLLYTNKVNNDSDHQWCESITLFIQPDPTAGPPVTDRGKKQLAAFTRLAEAKDCI